MYPFMIMARKVQISAAVEPEQLDWMDEQIDSNAQLVRLGIEKLRQERENNV